MVVPQSSNQMRFVGAADLFNRIKACNFFRYATSARNRSFSSSRACAESVATIGGGAWQLRSGFMFRRPCFLFSSAAAPP